MKSCLLVGARNETRQTVCGFLARRHFDIREASGPGEALEVCRQGMPDVIVFDDGGDRGQERFTFLRRLRRVRRNNRTVVLYCSDDTDPAAIGTAITDGASDCLVKPFDADLLEFKLEQAGLDLRDGD